MDEKRKHVWVLLPEVDSSRCEFCGMIATQTVIGCHEGIPECGEGHDLDEEMSRLLAGELPPPDVVD